MTAMDAKHWLGAAALVALMAPRPAALAAQGTPADTTRTRIVAAAADVMQSARYATLITIGEEGQPQARIVDPFAPESGLTIWIATNALTRKVQEIRADSRVTLLYFNAAASEYVTILGRAELVSDSAAKAAHWKEDWATFYKDKNRGSDYLLIRVRPTRIEISSPRQRLMNDPVTWRPVILDLPQGTAPLPAQGLPADSVFDHLIGPWVLQGTIAGQQTTHDVTFTWMLGRSYVQMHEVSREKNPDGTPAYEAVVLFGRDPKSGEYAALWLDNTESAAFPPAGTGRGKVAGDSIPFLWNYSATDRFHNTFVYHRTGDRWEWHMDNDSAGVRRPFARVTLTRP